jgi:hypothetical protein
MANGATSSHAGPTPSVVTVTLTPAFKLVFLSVLTITILSIILCCPLVFLTTKENDPRWTALLEACLTTWKMGFGAIIGLLGGKSL